LADTNGSIAARFVIPAAGSAVVSGDTLLILAEDGSLLAFDKKSGVDLVGPQVKMLYPAEGAQLNAQNLTLVFRISDEASGFQDKTLKITVGGNPVDAELLPDGTAAVYFTELGKNKPLGDGRAEIVVSISDWMGNKTDQHFTILIDNTLPVSAAPANVTPPGRGGGGAGVGGAGGAGVGGSGGGGR